MKFTPFLMVSLLPCLVWANNDIELPSLTVEADLRGADAAHMATSVHVHDELQLQDTGASHYQDVLLQTPNVNFAGGSSRPRHLLIRGMGEREDYTGAPNPSVGFAMDGVDFSGIGMVGSLFDSQQLEVLRGSQSTRYGASAMAGLVNVHTNEPTAYRESLLEATLGSDNLRQIGLLTSGAMAEGERKPLYRVSVFAHGQDGFRRNQTLGRKDTNQKKELTGRAKLRWWAGANTQFDLMLLHAHLDNGYDIFTRSNNFTTYSGQPGKDTQKSKAASLKVHWQGAAAFTLLSTTSVADANMLYSYDEDWLAEPDGFYRNKKKRKNYSQEIRLLSSAPIWANSTDWLVGAYAARLDEDNHNGVYWGSWNLIDRSYQQDKLAGFAQFDHHLTPSTTLVVGARVEEISSKFSDSAGERFAPRDTFWGGEITLNQQLNGQHSVYAGVSRGYKASGFNTGLQAGAEDKYLRFASETALNYSLGHRVQTGRLSVHSHLFYTERTNAQFDGNSYDPSHTGGSDPSWVFFIENFSSAKNYGLETEASWQASDALGLFANLGLLRTQVQGTPLNADFAIDGRSQAYAPRYQYLLGAQLRHPQGWFARAEVQGLGSYYFDNVHNETSRAYALTHARVGYEAESWEVYLWGRNLFNQRYANRGFYFDPDYGNNPRAFYGLGDPRQVGITTRVHF